MPTPTKPTPELAYLQRHAALLVTNNRLRGILFLLAAFICALTLGYVSLAKSFASYKPMVIRINEVGHAEAITYSDTEYKIQDAEIKYFLMQFLQQHYGRVRGSAKDDLARSLYFMTPKLADQRLSEVKETKWLDEFLLGIGDQIEVTVHNISIEDLRQQPYKATITYEKQFFSQLDHQFRNKATFTAHVQFIVLDKVPHSLVAVNPLGLTITYLREDQAFSDTPQPTNSQVPSNQSHYADQRSVPEPNQQPAQQLQQP